MSHRTQWRRGSNFATISSVQRGFLASPHFTAERLFLIVHFRSMQSACGLFACGGPNAVVAGVRSKIRIGCTRPDSIVLVAMQQVSLRYEILSLSVPPHDSVCLPARGSCRALRKQHFHGHRCSARRFPPVVPAEHGLRRLGCI